MIKIKTKKKSGDLYIIVKGHANYAPYGKDIVCSGISAILQTAILGLKAIAEAYPNHVKVEEEE